MKTAMTLLIVFVMLASCFAQSPSAKWQVATIVAVKFHSPAAGEDAAVAQYDVTLKVGNAEYIVLYVPQDGTLNSVGYHPGMDCLVLIGADTIKFNDLLGRTRELPIISGRLRSAKIPLKKPDKP